MAITRNPITLPANKFATDLTQLLVQSRVAKQYATQGWERQIWNKFAKDQVTYGGGINYTFLKDPVNPKYDRVISKDTVVTTGVVTDQPNQNPYNYVNHKSFAQASIWLTDFKFTLVTYDAVDTKDMSFENSTLVSDYMSLILDSNTLTIEEDFANIALALWNADKGVQTGQTLTLDLYDLAAITDPDTKMWATQQNAITIKSEIARLLMDIQTRRNDLTDSNENYTKLNEKELYAIFNYDYILELAKGGVQMFNPKVIDDMLPNLNRIELPGTVVTNKNRICTLQTDIRHDIIAGYRIGRSLPNDVTLEQTNFDHYSYGVGIFTDAPFIEVVANATLKPTSYMQPLADAEFQTVLKGA